MKIILKPNNEWQGQEEIRNIHERLEHEITQSHVIMIPNYFESIIVLANGENAVCMKGQGDD